MCVRVYSLGKLVVVLRRGIFVFRKLEGIKRNRTYSRDKLGLSSNGVLTGD